jgi:NAD(P)-dependent dehydrogenase (short-subunit alcohol dehydrogenase family)
LVLNARGLSSLNETAKLCEEAGGRAVAIKGDISESETARKLVEQAVALENFRGFIHNAGIARPGPFLWELPQDHFFEVIGANLIGAYQIARFAFPELIRQGTGIAVFLGSGAAEITFPGIGAYCIAKAAEEHLAKQLATEAPSITTFIYRPGIVDTRMQAEARRAKGGAAEILHEEFRGYKSRGELMTPEQAADGLIHILMGNPKRFHGRVATWAERR